MIGDLEPRGWILGATLQGALAATTLLALAFSPGELGRTLLVPVNGASIDRSLLKQLMLKPLAPGPLPGSIVVDGRGRSLAATLFDKGIIMLAAPTAACGDGSSAGVRHDE